MTVKQFNEALNELPAQIDASLNERKAARPSRRRAAHIKANERDAILRELGSSPNRARITAVAERFNRGSSTISKMARACGL